METSQDIPDTETHHVKPEIGAEPHLDQVIFLSCAVFVRNLTPQLFFKLKMYYRNL